MPLDWRARVDELTDVQRLVHLAARLDSVSVEEWRGNLLGQMRRCYEAELTAMAARVGCPGRQARLNNGPILSELNDQAAEWAAGICNTYNYDLAAALHNIGVETPRANRNTYVKRLQAWDQQREKTKSVDIAAYTEGWTRSKAQADFRAMNGTMGTARLVPTEAVCPVCLGLVARGEIPLREALKNPPPFHPRCPHNYEMTLEQVARDDCPLLWLGE